MDKPNDTAKYKPISLAEFQKNRKQPRDINREIRTKVGPLDRLAMTITEGVGTMGFFLLIFIWTASWLSWNLLAPKDLQFDPPMAFVLWLFISNLIQILLMPLIMLGQNLQGQHAEARAEYDLDVNVKAEREIEAILYHLEYQNRILIALMEKQGVKLDEAALKQAARETSRQIEVVEKETEEKTPAPKKKSRRKPPVTE